MRSIDTNVLLRWITRDDPAQALVADRVMAAPSYVTHTVLLEVAWVLGGTRYRFSRAALAETLLALTDTATIQVSARDGVRWALGAFAKGADFADAMHLVASAGSTAFATFDRRLALHAESDSPIPVELLP